MPKYEIKTHFNGKRIIYNDYLESASKVISACISCIENPSFDTEEFEDLLTLVKMFRDKVNFECSLEPDKQEDKNKAKKFWNNLIRLKCVHEESIQGHTGETLRYFLVDAEKAKSPSAKELVSELEDGGGAFSYPEMGLVFVLKDSDIDKITLFHESGHAKFRQERVYRSIKFLTGYDRFVIEEVYCDNWGVDNVAPSERAEMIRKHLTRFLIAGDPITTCLHLPRILNMWERYKEVISS